MLDNNNVLKQRDPQNALGFAGGQPAQLAYNFGFAQQKLTGGPFANVVVAGMGGSAIPAELLRTFPEIQVPLVISRDYTLPDFVGKNSLVICSSFSGNTEETLAALADAKKRGATIVVSAHGGQLAELAKADGLPMVRITDSPQPRMAVLATYRAFVEILVAAGLAVSESLEQLNEVASRLETTVKQWTPDMPAGHNVAKQLAEQLAGKTAIVYAGPKMLPAAFKWKISVNENAKNTCWANVLPEFNHNEMIGWSSHPVEKPFAVVNLLSSFEHPRVLQRFEVTERLLSGLRPKAINVQAVGESALEHMLYLILLGDFSSLYLAVLNGVNPTPVALVEKFKKELG